MTLMNKSNFTNVIIDIIINRKGSILLIFLPFGFLSHVQQWSPECTFWFNFLAMIPLANMLGEFTEELAMTTNPTIGGLLNATFGNAVEIVVAINALKQDKIRVVQASLLGSILSNLLLVLGCCFFFGGLKVSHQRFNRTIVVTNTSLLALASFGLVLPTPFAAYYDVEDEHVLSASRVASLFLISMYAQLMVFQLVTHTELFDEEDDEDDDEEEERVVLTFGQALAGLTIVTAIITFLSDWLVASVEGFVETSGLSETFVSIVLIPIVGNAVEHMSAVSVAMKGKMDLAMAIAIGSSTQIALFVIPLAVLVGWGTGKSMTLNFPVYEMLLFVMSVFVACMTCVSGSSNWLQGSLLLTTYLMVAAGIWFENVINY